MTSVSPQAGPGSASESEPGRPRPPCPWLWLTFLGSISHPLRTFLQLVWQVRGSGASKDVVAETAPTGIKSSRRKAAAAQSKQPARGRPLSTGTALPSATRGWSRLTAGLEGRGDRGRQRGSGVAPTLSPTEDRAESPECLSPSNTLSVRGTGVGSTP